MNSMGLNPSSLEPKPHASRPAQRLGERLLAAGLVSRFQLEMALQEQLSTKKRLGEIVVAKGWVPYAVLEKIAAGMIHNGTKSVRSVKNKITF